MTARHVFVLNAGRSGSRTFALACTHIANWTAGHETLARVIGPDRWRYPDRHIEVDHRLAWRLGSLARRYPDAVYVHLRRDPEKVAASYARFRFGKGASSIMAGWQGISFRAVESDADRLTSARDFVTTVEDNIAWFLADREHIVVPIEDPHGGFDRLWDLIEAEGDRAGGHAELEQRHHANGSTSFRQDRAHLLLPIQKGTA